MWQSHVFAVSLIWLALALWPTIRNTEARIPLSTSIQNIIISLVLGITHLSLGFFTAFLTSMLILAEWAFIAHKRRPPCKSSLSTQRPF